MGKSCQHLAGSASLFCDLLAIENVGKETQRERERETKRKRETEREREEGAY